MKTTRLRSMTFTIAATLIFASMLLAACGAPAAEPAAPIAEPAVPEATEIPTTEPAQPELGAIIFEETFTDNSNNWSLSSNDDVVSVIEDGKLTGRFFTFGSTWKYTPPVSAEDVDISVDIELVAGNPQNVRYGVYCKYIDKDNSIFVAITPQGSFTIQKRLNGEWIPLVGYTNSALIQQGVGMVNNLRVICNGEHVTLFINGSLAADVVDTSLSGGTFYLMANPTLQDEDDQNPVVVSFDNLVVREPLPWQPPAGVLLSDSFDNNDNAYYLNDPGSNGFHIQNGKLVMTTDQPDDSWWTSLQVQLTNVDVSFNATIQEGEQSNAWYGVMCRRVDENNYYDFVIAGGGWYFLQKQVNDSWETLVEWTSSPAIKVGIGETNHIQVICSGSNLELYANGEQLFSVQDTSIVSGGYVLEAGRYDNDAATVSVAFDDLEVKYP